MQLKTSSLEFEKFGSVYEQPVVPDHNDMISREWHLIARRSISQLYHFDCEVFLEMQSGMAALLVGDAPEADCSRRSRSTGLYGSIRAFISLWWPSPPISPAG